MKNNTLDKTFKKEELTPQNLTSSEKEVLPQKVEVHNPDEPSLPHDKLLTVLYWIWDAFDRALMNMFLIGPTHDQVKAQKDLSGRHIYCGIRKLEWRSGGRRIFDVFAGAPDEETNEKAVYKNSDVTVEVYFFDDDICISTTDQVLYRNENFRMPSPYSRFIEVFGEVWK